MAANKEHKWVDFASPPVVERVFSVQFEPIESVQTAHFGLLWDLYREHFPKTTDQQPLPHMIEPVQKQEIAISDQPPLRRVWFESADGLELIQIQHDRFLYNNRSEAGSEYVDYEKCFERFTFLWGLFTNFAATMQYGDLSQDQYELTFMNHIMPSKYWRGFEDAGNIFVNFEWNVENRLLPTPESIIWQMVFPLPDGLGKLYAKTATGNKTSTGELAFQLEMTARGRMQKEEDGIVNKEWFALAHQQIVQGFAELTSPKMHEIWQRKK